MGINIGKYSELVTILARTETQSASGAVSYSFASTGQVWAEVVPTGGTESNQSDEKTANRVVKFRIRKQGVTINEKMRLRWNGLEWDINSIDEFGTRLNVGYEIRAISKDSAE